MSVAGFTYDPETGKCKDNQGQEGLNPVDLEVFAREEGSRIISHKVAECVDFRNFDFYEVIAYDYTTLQSWNLRGADFTGAKFFFANIFDADFSGAKLTGLQSGYALIGGRVDSHTQGRPRFLVSQSMDL
jgi:uncharacterized protein YjbI with pentapeptide repeats